MKRELIYLKNSSTVYADSCLRSEANIIQKKYKPLGRFIPYFTRDIWNKTIQ